MTDTLRIAILAHSTNPRGGVVHALALGDALARLGHEACVFAPDAGGRGFFRETLCGTVCVKASPICGGGTAEMVRVRVADYLRHFEAPSASRFDIYHAQDGISGNALATLKERGRIARFMRTVHHVDDFADPVVAALQTRSIRTADRHVVVSRVWQDALARELGIAATLIANGVDAQCFSPQPDATDAEVRARLGLDGGVLFVAIGGVEARKNTVRLLEAFATVHAAIPDARLVVAGGASLLDHNSYRAHFDAALAETGVSAHAVMRTGPLPQRLMPALYRAATTIAYPSVCEGFGLVVLEALASGTPVVTSRIAPFIEYLAGNDVLWCDPLEPASIADALLASLEPTRRAIARARAPAVVARHDWMKAAGAHIAAYADLLERVDA